MESAICHYSIGWDGRHLVCRVRWKISITQNLGPSVMLGDREILVETGRGIFWDNEHLSPRISAWSTVRINWIKGYHRSSMVNAIVGWFVKKKLFITALLLSALQSWFSIHSEETMCVCVCVKCPHVVIPKIIKFHKPALCYTCGGICDMRAVVNENPSLRWKIVILFHSRPWYYLV